MKSLLGSHSAELSLPLTYKIRSAPPFFLALFDCNIEKRIENENTTIHIPISTSEFTSDWGQGDGE